MENYNNPDIAKLNMETSKRLAESMKGWDGTNSMSNPVNGSYSTGATAQMLKESNNNDFSPIGKQNTSFSFGVINTITALKNSSIYELPAGKIMLEKYDHLALNRGISEAFLIENLIGDLEQFAWENSVAPVLENLKTIFEGRRREVEVVKTYESIKNAPGRELFSDATIQMKEWLVSENRSSDSLIHGLKRFSFNPTVRNLVSFLSISENENTSKFYLGHDNNVCEVTNVYSPLLVSENQTVFYSAGKFLKVNDAAESISECEASEITPEFANKAAMMSDKDVKITSDRISLNLGKNKVDVVYEGENKTVYFDNSKINEKDLPTAVSVSTNNLLENTNYKVSKAIFVCETADEIVDIDFAKKIRSKVYEGVEANLFKVGSKIYVQTVNPSMKLNKVYEANSTQAINIVKEFIKYDISESLTEFLQGEQAFLSVMKNDKKEILKNIDILESEIVKIEQAVSQNPLLKNSDQLNALKESIEEEILDLKDKWNQVNVEINNFENDSEEITSSLSEDLGYPIDTEVRVKRNGVKGTVIGVDGTSKTYTVLFKEGKTGEYFFSDVEDINDEVDSYSIETPDMELEFTGSDDSTNESEENFAATPTKGDSAKAYETMFNNALAKYAKAPGGKASGDAKFIDDSSISNMADVTKVKSKSGGTSKTKPGFVEAPKGSTAKGKNFVDKLDNLNLAAAPSGSIKGSTKFIEDLKNQNLATLKENQKNANYEKAPKGKDEKVKRFADKEDSAELVEAPGNHNKNGKNFTEDLKRAGLSKAPASKSNSKKK